MYTIKTSIDRICKFLDTVPVTIRVLADLTGRSTSQIYQWKKRGGCNPNTYVIFIDQLYDGLSYTMKSLDRHDAIFLDETLIVERNSNLFYDLKDLLYLAEGEKEWISENWDRLDLI